MENRVEKIWDFIVENGIANERELTLVTNINGYSEETLNSVIRARTGYQNIEQMEECEEL